MGTNIFFMEVADTTDGSSINCKLSFYAELLVRSQAIKQLGLCNSEIIFETNDYGKPRLKNNDKFHFNISHTCNAIVVVISDSEVGVDVEKLLPCNFKIVERFFMTREAEYIYNSSSKDEAFSEIWTKKEAYIKYKGKGLSLPLKSFCVMDKAISDRMYTIRMKEYLISLCEDIITPKTIIEIRESNFVSVEISKLNTKHEKQDE